MSGAPADPKARKTFNDAVGWEHKHALLEAVSQYRKANKQAGGACVECLRRAYQDAISAGDYKSAESIARDSLSAADNDVDKATAHFRIGVALQQQGIANRKERCFSESCDEFKSALTLDPTFTTVHYSLGTSLAHLHQDEQARTEFSEFIDKDKLAPGLHGRAARYLQNIDLARARMAPAFAVTTIDGRHVSMDSLAGKVVLIDFWATWCGPCREALPHIRQIARRFEGQPLVVLSISLDKDEDKWRDFVAKNGMTWLQYRDGGFDGPIATLFGVSAIPATFTIDADGVLEDQHVGDADIEGKLKKLIVRASEAAAQKQQAAN
ncbi:MAG TPA: redoxin domain-containing protein [Terracidiphilus sp.]|nr:redoxin domain-containing protein [Terracidiphilus sp.]